MSNDNVVTIQQVRELVHQAKEAQREFSQFSPNQVSQVVMAVSQAGQGAAEHLARLEAGETGMGRVESKCQKNLFAVRQAYAAIKGIKSCGIVGHDQEDNVYEIAQPLGLIGSILPMTSPVAMILLQSIMALQARNCLVFVPPTLGTRSIGETIELLHKAAVAAGAPAGCLIGLPATGSDVIQEILQSRDIAFLLATGPSEIVTAVYRSGKPAIATGWGNSPAYIDRTAELPHAVRCIVASKLFDLGLGFAAEEALVIDDPLEKHAVDELVRQGCHILQPGEVSKIEKLLFTQEVLNPKIIGQPAARIAQLASFQVPTETKLLIAPLSSKTTSPLARPKLTMVLPVYFEKGWEVALGRCQSLLELGNGGNAAVVHTTNPDVVMEFAACHAIPRLLVNAPAAQGAIGMATGLQPSFLLGCGTNGGCISNDNLSAKNFFQIKRVAALHKDFSVWDKERPVNPQVRELKLTETTAAPQANPPATDKKTGPWDNVARSDAPKPPSPATPPKKADPWQPSTQYPQPRQPTTVATSEKKGWPWTS